MKKQLMISSVAIIFSVAALMTAVSAESDHSGHAMGHSGKQMDHSDHQMDHSQKMGDMIRNTTVDGYGLMYHLIDMKAQMKQMKGMKSMPEMASHHLMVYITSPQGKPVGHANVGYLVEGTDGKKQKAMCMAMSGGFGADVNLTSKGTVKIKAKAVVGGKKIMDEFEYTLK